MSQNETSIKQLSTGISEEDSRLVESILNDLGQGQQGQQGQQEPQAVNYLFYNLF